MNDSFPVWDRSVIPHERSTSCPYPRSSTVDAAARFLPDISRGASPTAGGPATCPRGGRSLAPPLRLASKPEPTAGRNWPALSPPSASALLPRWRTRPRCRVGALRRLVTAPVFRSGCDGDDPKTTSIKPAPHSELCVVRMTWFVSRWPWGLDVGGDLTGTEPAPYCGKRSSPRPPTKSGQTRQRR